VSTTTSAAQVAADSPILKKLKELHPNRPLDALKQYASTIEQHEAKQGEPVAWRVLPDGRLLVFRRPTQDEWEDVNARLKVDPVPVVNRQLALQTALEPKPEDLAAVFKRWPGLHARIGDALSALVGADEELVAKKD
jgi:hypothetical protein